MCWRPTGDSLGFGIVYEVRTLGGWVCVSRSDPATALCMLLLCVLGRLMRLVTRSGNRISGRIRRKENQPVPCTYVLPSHILQFSITMNNSIMYVKQTTTERKLSLHLELFAVVCTEHRFGIGTVYASRTDQFQNHSPRINRMILKSRLHNPFWSDRSWSVHT